MSGFDPLLLARAQFGANISFHILFPAITIAMGWVLLFFKLRFNKTGDEKWMDAYRLFVKIFALSFALGVVSGITMSFQFGTNWPGFMLAVGNVAGPLLAYEVMTAFFLEATFLGIMLFGWKRVSNRIHTLATVLVAGGTTLSAFWILCLNSWMQTPAGFEIIDGVAFVTDWWAVIFNPSMPYRVAHMLLASGLTCSFLIAGISAYQWLKGQRNASVIATLKTGVYLSAILIPLQIGMGDLQGLNTLEHQPAKVAAMEGIWETEKGAALRLFAMPDDKAQVNHHEIKIPYLSSIILTHSRVGEIKGLKTFEDHPSMTPIFYGFRLMVGIGILMLMIAWWGAATLRGKKQPSKYLAHALVAMTFSGWGATLAGWYTTEIGRQPWLVSGILRTSQAASDVPSKMLWATLLGYITVYILLIIAFIFTVFYMASKPPKRSAS